jgi:ribosomal protein S18 acetylase RimI-like enzyme
MDIRMTLTRDLSKRIPLACTNITMRYGQPTDAPTLRELTTYHDSRFYYDLHLRPKCDEMFRIWVERSCAGYADQVFIGEMDGQVAGYITIKKNEIILVGSTDQYQHRGTTGELLMHVLHYLNEQGYAQATVVTQGRNVAALRLYQNYGFLTHKVQLWWHWWRA